MQQHDIGTSDIAGAERTAQPPQEKVRHHVTCMLIHGLQLHRQKQYSFVLVSCPDAHVVTLRQLQIVMYW